MTDNRLKTISSLDDIQKIRVTQVEGFHGCPARFKAAFLGEGNNNKSKAAEIGTALHLVIERYLCDQFELYTPEWEEYLVWLHKKGVPTKERQALLTYLQSLESMRQHVIAVEWEFPLSLVSGAPDIVGHIDATFCNEQGGITIRDHKSNRQFEGVSEWKKKFQPILYAIGVSEHYPGHAITFEIGYIILGEVVSWNISVEELAIYKQHLTRRYAEMWEEILVYRRTGEWPERPND